MRPRLCYIICNIHHRLMLMYITNVKYKWDRDFVTLYVTYLTDLVDVWYKCKIAWPYIWFVFLKNQHSLKIKTIQPSLIERNCMVLDKFTKNIYTLMLNFVIFIKDNKKIVGYFHSNIYFEHYILIKSVRLFKLIKFIF